MNNKKAKSIRRVVRSVEISEVARYFNLPPHKIKDLMKLSLSDIELEQASRKEKLR